MKIAIFIPHITRKPGFENNVSAHVQLPCEIAARLEKEDHDVEILTDSLVEGYTLPVCFPSKIPLIPMAGMPFITSADRIPFFKAIRALFSFFAMARRIKKRITSERYDVIHFYGTERVLLLIRIVALFQRPSTFIAFTFNQYIPGEIYQKIRHSRWCWKPLNAVITSTETLQKKVPEGVPTHLLRHGIVKNLSAAIKKRENEKPPHRILFWRTPNHLNGGDICVEVFRKLAPLYPDVDFDLAIRAESKIADLEAYEREVPNGHVFRFPYSDGITLETLLAESIGVFLPFREYTYYPQFVILESLFVGVPVVTSDLPGAREMIRPGENGFLFPLKEPAQAEKAIQQILDGEITLSSARIREEIARVWSWDGYEKRLLKIYESASDFRA